MEGNVIAPSICIISIDQASSSLLFFMLGSGSGGGLFGSHITFFTLRPGAQSVTQFKNRAGSARCDRKRQPQDEAAV